MQNLKKFLNIFQQLIKFIFIFLFLQIPGSIILGIYFLINPVTIKLPLWLRWFDGADQYFGRDTSVYDAIMKESAWQKYIWLAWRNPLNYFGYKYLGINISDKVQIVLDSRTANNSSLQVGDGVNKCSGTVYTEIAIRDSIYGGWSQKLVRVNESKYFEYYKIVKYNFFGSTKCVRIRIGWKIGQDRPIQSGPCQWVFVISPFHSYDGV